MTIERAVLAVNDWPSNAEMILDAHRLGYLRDDDVTLDPTYGEGVWWKQWRPRCLVGHIRSEDGVDFRHLKYHDRSFDAIAYDPPYCCPGGRKTSTIKAMHDRFGMAEGGYDDPMFRTPEELQRIINDGLTEMYRVVNPAATKAMDPTRPNGVVLVKCMDYRWSGRFYPGTHHTLTHALALGFDLEARWTHVGDPGPQPSVNPDGTPRAQKSARNNCSTLLILRRTP